MTRRSLLRLKFCAPAAVVAAVAAPAPAQPIYLDMNGAPGLLQKLEFLPGRKYIVSYDPQEVSRAALDLRSLYSRMDMREYDITFVPVIPAPMYVVEPKCYEAVFLARKQADDRLRF